MEMSYFFLQSDGHFLHNPNIAQRPTIKELRS